MEYTVFDRGAAVGSASAERRGLYWHIAAECRMETDRIVRLYAHDGEKRVRLGVLMPEDGAELDMDYEPGREFPLMPLFCFCTLEELDGALRWRMKLDENMQPVMPEEKKPLTTG